MDSELVTVLKKIDAVGSFAACFVCQAKAPHVEYCERCLHQLEQTRLYRYEKYAEAFARHNRKKIGLVVRSVTGHFTGRSKVVIVEGKEVSMGAVSGLAAILAVGAFDTLVCSGTQGNPPVVAPLPAAPTYSVDKPGIVTLAPSADGLSCVVTGAAPGSCVVTVSDAQLNAVPVSYTVPAPVADTLVVAIQ